jgi:hypothetical protein
MGRTASWHVVHVDWVGGEDRFAVLACEPEPKPEYRKVSGDVSD